jgi:hypothetical protein
MRLYQRNSLYNPLIYPANKAVGIGMEILKPKAASCWIDAFKIYAESGISLHLYHTLAIKLLKYDVQ